VPGLLPNVDPNGLLEYSVVFTDRALNHMSQAFQGVMRDISATLKHVYPRALGRGRAGRRNVRHGSRGAPVRDGAQGLVIRNGWFSYRWTQIFDMGRIPSGSIVLKARAIRAGRQAPYAPAPIDEVVATIREQRPAVVFAPHVETASGMILPDNTFAPVADCRACRRRPLRARLHRVGRHVGRHGSDRRRRPDQRAAERLEQLACARARDVVGARANRDRGTTSTSFACDLKKWLSIMEAYEKGGHAYHGTMPTDALTKLRDAMRETGRFGFERARAAQAELGAKVRALFTSRGIPSVVAPRLRGAGRGRELHEDPGIHTGAKFIAQGLQTAAGVPLQCDEPADFKTFRVGLFGLDKLANVAGAVANLERALAEIESQAMAPAK
jgi:aspartate aminotransferase-like enzyme